MQKKSLLVALFCGALCLTGCLKNEESASVVQVRNAKANELNSIATLNEAKAAAELIYANADATLKGAEAELKKAEAALVLAMAETEKVRAELLKTQVALQEVKVEEEGIELLKKAAELEILLAKVEVEQAKAEAQKQYWANELEQLIADAEVAAVENGLELLKAQDAVEKYILTQEGAKADSAKVYARKFFKAQEKVAELQVAELAARAARVLIENNAMSTREWIHNEIDKKNDTIAFNEARIAALEKYLDVDPETAKAELEKAWTALNVAYNDYQDKATAKTNAEKELSYTNNKTADFTQNWDLFKNNTDGLKSIFNHVHQDINVTVGEYPVTVEARGISVPSKTEEGKFDFIPFWSYETEKPVPGRYPDITVVKEGKGKNYVALETTLIAPATIYYDNIDDALDYVNTAYKDNLDKAVKAFGESLDARINEGTEEKEAWSKEIAENKELIDLHDAYLKARETKVKAAENAYIAELKKAETYKSDKAAAWKDFEDYMVINHDELRDLFIERNKADSAFAKAKKDSTDAYAALNEIATGIPTLVEGVVAEFEKFAVAEGKYNLANYNATHGKGAEAKGKITASENRWNPEFEAAVEDGFVPTPYGNPVMETKQGEKSHHEFSFYAGPTTPGAEDGTQWAVTVGGKTIQAGSAQDSVWTYKGNRDIAYGVKYQADIDMKRFPSRGEDDTIFEGFEDLYDDADGFYKKFNTALTTASTGIEAIANAAGEEYKDHVKEYYNQYGKYVEEAMVAYNPEFNNNNIFALCSFWTPAFPNAEHRMTIVMDWSSWPFSTPAYYAPDEDGKWMWNGEEAGTAQADLLDAAKAAADAFIETKGHETWGLNGRTALDEMTDATSEYDQAKERLYNANKALMQALGVEFPEDLTPEEMEEYVAENIGKYIDKTAEEKYQAYVAIEYEDKLEEVTAALNKAYGIHPDAIYELQNGKRDLSKDGMYVGLGVKENAEDPEQFGWLVSSYHVDYEATMIDIAGGKGEFVPIANKIFKKSSGNPQTEKAHTQTFEVSYDEDSNEFTRDVENVYLDKDGNIVTYNKALDTPVYSVSLAYKNERIQKKIDAVPGLKKEAENQAKTMVETLKQATDKIKTNVNSFKALETGYKAWIAERQTAEKKFNQAKIDEFEAQNAVNEAKAEYEAAKAAVDGKVWLYDSKKTKKLGNTTVADPGFVEVSIPEAIAKIEAENAEIEARKHELELDLKYGKLTYQTVMEVLDETIEVLSADIEIWTAIANQYKAVMNGYLGIVDGEATPVVEEGEDEE